MQTFRQENLVFCFFVTLGYVIAIAQLVSKTMMISHISFFINTFSDHIFIFINVEMGDRQVI